MIAGVGMAGPIGGRGPTTPRAIARYLRALRPVLLAPRLARRAWIRDVGRLIEEARSGDPIALSRQAGSHGRDVVPVFRDARRRLSDLSPPPECQELHAAIEQWIVQHVEACELLMRIEEQRTLRSLRDVQERLAEGRAWAGRFNAAYVRVVEDLRRQVARGVGREVGRRTSSGAARRLARLRSFFGRQPSS
jgi:hypothetical protein